MTVYIAGLFLQVAGQSAFQKCYTVGHNEHCFKTYIHTKKAWMDAQTYCDSSEHYSLVALDDHDIHVRNALTNFLDLSDLLSLEVWTGITRKTRGEWFWVDETPYTGIDCPTATRFSASSYSVFLSLTSFHSCQYIVNVITFTVYHSFTLSL